MISLRTPHLGPIADASADAILARAHARLAEIPCLVVTDEYSIFCEGSREWCERWITWQLKDDEAIAGWQSIDVDPMEFHVADNTIERILLGWGYSL